VPGLTYLRMFQSHTVEYKQDRKRTYKRNVEVRSSNHFCHVKARRIIYSECVSVAFCYQAYKAHSPYYVVIRGLSSYIILSDVISETARLLEKRVIEYEMCVLISLQLLSDTVNIIRALQRDIIMYTGLHAK